MSERLANRHWGVEFPAIATRLAEVRVRLDAWLRTVGLPDDDRYDLVIAVNEAMSNAVEHAYPPGEPGRVRVAAEVRPDGRLRVVVADCGAWRVPPVALSDRGRGLLLMRENVDEVQLDRSADGTSVTLVLAARHTTRGTFRPASTDQVLVVERSGWVEVVVLGDVPARDGPAVRRRILTAARGGSVPIVVDLRGLGTRVEGVVRSLRGIAEAASAAGNRVVVRAPERGPAHTALVAAGVDQVVDLVAHASPPTVRRPPAPPPAPRPPSRAR
ncbi:ATP-binding protein [Actinosynnema sp. NPDC047251]|uniref:Anti-sigma regulatory factor, serine/threonine protein kinase n=1 Tax=Saccharothrix espanaensis (strain ATCC 51144 / DSM 44229 / JCM 9112 / NBRC 15066 / NRRL 15764) TaxID=1179773 RepID=K0K873_SACES|nr:ATP-binding protein [Saccharothrix espanaensis]CCH33727.1 Anti-sigma regulatory factor, serine/threonine protein kinase [Saccharothrix espanaensis DSM 44229]